MFGGADELKQKREQHGLRGLSDLEVLHLLAGHDLVRQANDLLGELHPHRKVVLVVGDVDLVHANEHL